MKKSGNNAEQELSEMAARIDKLERAVFGDWPGGPNRGPGLDPVGPKGGLGARLNALADELAALKADSSRGMFDLSEKIDTVIRITAELRSIVEESVGARGKEKARALAMEA